MSRDTVVIAAYVALSVWVFATITVGFLYHFGNNGGQYQPWVLPMGLLTISGAIVVDRIKKARGRR
jgi:hypothetical protein